MVQVGDRIPQASFAIITTDGPSSISAAEVFDGKKVVLLGIVGAFTGTCSNEHLPEFVRHAAALGEKGVETIACVAVNDADVMAAWGRDQNVGDKVLLLADGSGAFAKALGLELDLTEAGLGIRNRRYSMIVDDGTITHLNVEPAGECGVSSAEYVLGLL